LYRWSYGILGRTGRGVTELQNVNTDSIDIIVGSLAHCIATGGGFCTGKKLMVEHQRLNSSAVTFSASLPTFLTTTASAVITRLQSEEGAKELKALDERVEIMRRQLEKSEWIELKGACNNPVLRLVIKEHHTRVRGLTRANRESLLQDIVDKCLSTYGILVTGLKSMPVMEGLHPREVEKEYQPEPAIKVCVSTALSVKETEKAGKAIRSAVASVMKRT
jgi:serine palmitoyltransferase